MASDVTLNYGSFNVWLLICSIYASILAFTAIIVAFILRKRRTCYYHGEKYSLRQFPRLSAHVLLNLDCNRLKVTHEVRTASESGKVPIVDVFSSESRVKESNKISFLEEQIQDVAAEKVCSDLYKIQGVNKDKIQNIQVLDTCSNPNNTKRIVNSSIFFKSDYLDSKWADEIGLFNLKDDIKYKMSNDDCQAIRKFGQIEKTFSIKNDSNAIEENLHPSYLQYRENTRQYTNNLNYGVTNLSIDNEISKILSYDTALCLKYCPCTNDSVVSIPSITKETESLSSNDDQMAFMMVNLLVAPVTFTYYGNVEQDRLHDDKIKNESDLNCNAAFTIPEQIDKHQESDIVFNANDETIYPDLSVSMNDNKSTEDVRHEIAFNHTSDNTEVIKGVEDIFEHHEMIISTFENDVDFIDTSVQLHDNNMVTKTFFSEKLPPEKRKTSVFVDKAGNISITLSPKELITDNTEDVSITVKTFVYKSDLGNVSVTQVLPAIDTEIEDSKKNQFQLNDENSFTTEEILSCVISDSEIQLKETYKKEINNDILSPYPKLPRPKLSITYDLGISKEQDIIPLNKISTINIKTTINQDNESKLDIKTLPSKNTKYFKDESKNSSFSTMIPGSLLFHKSEIETKDIINNNIKTPTNQKLPTHVILSELKLKQQLYIESDAKNKFTEPTTLISSERSTIHHLNKEKSNLSYTSKLKTGETKSMLDSITSFKKHNLQKSIVTKIRSENDFYTDASAIMRAEKTEQETTTSSTRSVLLDTETSTTGIENVITSNFMMATQRISTSSFKRKSLDRESCSFIKFISNDVIMDCIKKDRSFYSHDVTESPVQPTLVTQNICLKNLQKYSEHKLCTDFDSIEIQNSESTVISVIKETVEKYILNDLLDMGDKYDSEIVDKNMTTVILKHADSNFQLKTTLHSKYHADHSFFSKQDDSHETVSYNESDNNGEILDNSDYSDLELISFEENLYEQPILHKTGNVANDYAFIESESNNQNDVKLKHYIKNRYFENVENTNTDVEGYQHINPMLSVSKENKPEDSAPYKLIAPQKNILALGSETSSLHPVELQNCVETETSTGFFKLSTSEKIVNDDKNADIFKDKTIIALISSLRKTSPSETTYETKNNKKIYVIPTYYLKDVSDEIGMKNQVKPVAEVLPFDTKEKKIFKQNSSTSSMEIQANIFTSSQIDLQPTSSYIIIPKQKSTNIVLPKNEKKQNEKLDAASALRLSASSPPKLSKNKNIYTTLPVIQFDQQHPLNNVLIPHPPLKFVEQHIKYNPA